MAEVLLALLVGSHGFERPVVVKRMLSHLARDPHFVRMFIDEARIIAGIRHPNVVQVVEFGSEGEELFLVMEYLEGETVSSLMRRMSGRRSWLDMALGAYVVTEACAGLHAAHELTNEVGESRNLVHRDVSPQNVFITYDGTVKVLDFGIAKAADRITRTETGQVKGKESYMSPEQALAMPLDRRSDIFSLGVVLYELTTARRLFKRKSKLETLEAVRDATVMPPSQIIPGYPQPLEAVCLRALSQNPEYRYPTAAAMRRDLLDAARSIGLDTVPDEALARWMHALFGDRVEEKGRLLKSLRGGQPISELPVAEVDLSIDIPGLESDVSNIPAPGEPNVEPTLTAHAWATNKGDVVGLKGTPQRKSRLLWVLPLLGGALCVVVVALAALLWPRGDETSEPSNSPPPAQPHKVAAAQPSSPQPPAPEKIPQASQAAPEEIVLELETTPAGATVLLNDEVRGQTPLGLRLPRGSDPAHIELRLDGYEPALETLPTDMNGRYRIALTPRQRNSARPRVRPAKSPRTTTPPAKAKTSTFRAFD